MMHDGSSTTFDILLWTIILAPMLWPTISGFLQPGAKRGYLEHVLETLVPADESNQVAPRILAALKAAGFKEQQFTPDNLVIAKRANDGQMGTDTFRKLPMQATAGFRAEPEGVVVWLKLKITTYVLKDTGESAYMEQLGRDLLGLRAADEPEAGNASPYWLDCSQAFAVMSLLFLPMHFWGGMEARLRGIIFAVLLFGALTYLLLIAISYARQEGAADMPRPWKPRMKRVILGLILGAVIHAAVFLTLYGAEVLDLLESDFGI